MSMHECTRGCGQVWEVFPVEDRDEDEARFSIYATRTINEGRSPVEMGSRFYEDDNCPTCGFPLGDILIQDSVIEPG